MSPELIERDDADCVVFRDGPVWNGKPAVAIGQFRCATVEAGAELLRDLARSLAAENRAGVIGPMDGDTWHSYRAVTGTDGSPPFLMEPTTGPHVAEAFRTAGFQPLATYVSTRAALADAIDTGAPFELDGISVGTWDGENAEALIGKLFAMSSQSFAGNAFYKPITHEAFLALYRPLMPAVDPRLVLFARDAGGGLQGFLFAVPDRLQGPRPGTVILKTYASQMKGVGRLLADAFHRRAQDLGFTDVVHALMHEDNVSRSSSERFRARCFRRYALFGRPLSR